MQKLWAESATTLSRRLAAGEVSSEEATRAHLDRIEALNPRVRAFTVVLRDEALAAARRADEERRRGDVRGPLHGMPVSVKESVEIEGQASTMGIRSRQQLLAKRDAGVVRALRQAGAVILGRTNVSQLLMFHESRNPVFGQTANPWSLAHTPGGSSGGEAAAIAAGMSPLGVGTDIGGSIRVPAHFAGICGLKPTLDRWSNRGSNTGLVGQEVIRGQIGPMARTARDVALLASTLDVAAMSEDDGRVPPVPPPRPEQVDVSRLRVGWYLDDAIVPPSLAVVRAVERAAKALEGRVARVVRWAPPRLDEAVLLYFAALSADGGATAWNQLDGTPIDPSLKTLRALGRLPTRIRRLAARAAGLAGEKLLERFLLVTGAKSVTELWSLTTKARAYRLEVLDAMHAEGLDLLLCPVHATPALPHGASRDFVLAGSPSMPHNLMQLPAGVVPVTRVHPEEARRERAKGRIEKRAAEVDAASAGLPVGVQIVGRPWREDEVLAVMMALEDAIASDPDRPVAPVDPT